MAVKLGDIEAIRKDGWGEAAWEEAYNYFGDERAAAESVERDRLACSVSRSISSALLSMISPS